MLARDSAAQSWTSIGPAPLAYSSSPTNPANFNSGRVASIAVDPSDLNHWLIGVGNGGVWESHDAGTSWAPLTDSAPTLATGAVAFAPSNPNIIYVGTGEACFTGFCQVGVGILKSTDGGRTWALLAVSSFARAAVHRVRVHPTNPNILLATTSRGAFGRDSQESPPSPPPFGILRSTDGGVTWVRTLAGQAAALEVDPTNSNNQYATISEIRNGIWSDSPGSAANGVYRSTDGGQSWTLIAGPWGVSSPMQEATGLIELAIAPSNPSVLYAGIGAPPNGRASSQPLLGLWRTDNAWAATPTWIQVSTAGSGQGGYCGLAKCNYAHILSVDPSNPNTLLAGGGDDHAAYLCSDCGSSATWTDISMGHGVHPDSHSTAWAANRFILGSDGGVWSTVDLGATWQDHNATLRTAMFFSGALHPTNPDIILGGLRDFSISIRTGTDTWLLLPGPGTGGEWGEAEVAMSSAHPDSDWMAAWIFGDIFRTTNGGQSGIVADTGIDKTGAAFVAPVRKCPSDDDVFVTGTGRVWRTDAFFSAATPTWLPNGPVHPVPFPLPNALLWPGTILTIDFAPSDPTCNTYAYGNRGGQVKLTTDGGSTWKDLDPGQNLPARPVNSLTFDPTSPNILYAALSSFDDATPGKPGHVFKTTNALSASPSWTNVSPPADLPHDVIVVDPRHPSAVYVGTDAGLWYSGNGAAEWERLSGPGTGMPNASVYDVKFDPTTQTLVAFTYGRSAFRLSSTMVGALLPASRSVQVGAAATAFVTIINAGTSTAPRVGIGLVTNIPARFNFQTTDPTTNQVTGAPDTPVDIQPGQSQTFVISLIPTAPFPSTDVAFTLSGSKSIPAPTLTGINTLLLSASTGSAPDIVALAATAGHDGIVSLPSDASTGAFAVATVNVGAGATITASADTGGVNLPVSLALCRTDPATGQCISPIAPSVSATIAQGETPTFTVFVASTAVVSFDPARHRVFVRFKDAGGVTRGSTSVAVRTPAVPVVSGQVEQIAAPASVVRGALDSSTSARFFPEQTGVPLVSGLSVNISARESLVWACLRGSSPAGAP